jgi:hypothetical protein
VSRAPRTCQSGHPAAPSPTRLAPCAAASSDHLLSAASLARSTSSGPSCLVRKPAINPSGTIPPPQKCGRRALSRFWKEFRRIVVGVGAAGTPQTSTQSLQFSPGRRRKGDRLPVPHQGTCQGIPPLRREPYAGLRRVSHEQRPERSRRRGRWVLVIDLCGPQVVATTRARTGRPIPTVCIASVLEASIQVVPAGRYLADALDGPARCGPA